MKTRIYIVDAGKVHLVEATNKTVAINYIARKDITAHVANQMELVEALGAGIVIERAGASDGGDE